MVSKGVDVICCEDMIEVSVDDCRQGSSLCIGIADNGVNTSE